jgi:hypothetical protein
MILILIFVGCVGDVCPHESAPTDIPVGAVELVAGENNVNLPNDATAEGTGQGLVVTYTDENGRTWRITYEVGELFSWYHD